MAIRAIYKSASPNLTFGGYTFVNGWLTFQTPEEIAAFKTSLASQTTNIQGQVTRIQPFDDDNLDRTTPYNDNPILIPGPPGRGIVAVNIVNNRFVFLLSDGSTLDGGAAPAGTPGRSVSGVTVNGSNRLIVQFSDSTTQDAGALPVSQVAGPTGRGVQSASTVGGNLVLTLTDNATLNAGALPAGSTGRGIVSALLNSSSHLIITYTDGSTQDAGLVAGGGTPTPTPTPVPSLVTTSNTSVNEGDSGSTVVSTPVTIVRDGLTGAQTVNVTYGGTATSGVDYTAGPATVVIGNGQSVGTLDLSILGDTGNESNETIILTFTLQGYGSATATRTITILNNDAAVDTPSTPVLTNRTSGWTTGDNPPSWDTEYDGVYYDPDSGKGDKIRFVWKLGGGAFAPSEWIPFDVDAVLTGIKPAFMTDGSLFAGGVFQVKVQAGRDVGLSSEVLGLESNIWQDTIASGAEQASGWGTANGTDRSQFVTTSGTPATVASLDQGGFNSAPVSTRADHARTGKRQFQVGLSTYAGDGAAIWIGVDDGTTNLNSGFPRPGKTNSAGISLSSTPTDWAIYVGGESVQSGSPAVGLRPVTGGALSCKFDTVAGTASFYMTINGTTLQFGATQAVSLTAWKANVGFESPSATLAKFGTGQARALDSGYDYYDK